MTQILAVFWIIALFISIMIVGLRSVCDSPYGCGENYNNISPFYGAGMLLFLIGAIAGFFKSTIVTKILALLPVVWVALFAIKMLAPDLTSAFLLH